MGQVARLRPHAKLVLPLYHRRYFSSRLSSAACAAPGPTSPQLWLPSSSVDLLSANPYFRARSCYGHRWPVELIKRRAAGSGVDGQWTFRTIHLHA